MAEGAMTDKQHRVLVNYIREIADKMGLRDWQFFLEKDFLSDTDKLGTTSVWGDSKTATIEFHEDFFKLGPMMQREVVVHELTHWHLDPVWKLVYMVVKDQLSVSAAGVMRAAYEQQMETVVDNIAVAWARTFPLINWKSTAKRYHGVMSERPPEDKKID